MLRKALQYQRLCGGVHRAARGGPVALAATASCTRATSQRALGIAGIPSISRVDDGRARRARSPRYEDGARPLPAPLLRASRSRRSPRAKAAGARVSAEVSPHHLSLTDEAVRALDTRFKMNPPLRTEDDRQALIEGLRDGTIDCVATDHAPHARDEKEVPFEQAPMGTTGLETAFAALHTELCCPGVLAARRCSSSG